MFSSTFAAGLLPGLLNGLLGTGGGILAVAFLRRQGLSQPQAQATALCLMLPLSVISLTVYALHGNFPFKGSLPFILPALAGSAAGAWLLKRISPCLLRLVFALLILYSASRALLS